MKLEPNSTGPYVNTYNDRITDHVYRVLLLTKWGRVDLIAGINLKGL